MRPPTPEPDSDEVPEDEIPEPRPPAKIEAMDAEVEKALMELQGTFLHDKLKETVIHPHQVKNV